ncbi:DUF4097 family beta strand repeat-containing protein [Actinoplanes sp. KI2]|uniref:DUF4097 family beta strand repeat-containing protein n=1 Tax=Actinoplanes sp. KI2 TaxID=2983315 RepID=UPI0021D572A5|nr:DUF4097 family beta strand repeat-containing protein [Actinoplanes sp. KI2]MCU7724571.1 DUF4097 family beta strand repeat-containing protein [Actinoplanes sp. KI2]
MTTIEHTAHLSGPITLHITTQAADVQIVADPRVSGTWIELSTPDTSGPAVDAIRAAEFRDDGRDVHLKLTEGTNIVNNLGSVTIGNYSSMTVVNGVVIGASGNFASSGITVRAITEPGSAVVVKTMSGDVTTKNVGAVRAQTMSGDIKADGLTRDSSLKSMSGDIRVTGDGRPRVTASTMSGDVTGKAVDLNARSMSGRVRQVA